MAAAGLRPCHLTGSRNSTVSQFNTQQQPQQQPSQQILNRKLGQFGSSLTSCSNGNLLGLNEVSDERKLVMSQQKMNLLCMIQFASSLMNALNGINRLSFQQFKLRVGVNTGPVIAGVIGAHRPFYDIWGDCVNVSARVSAQAAS